MVPIFYDSLLAKLIVYGSTREEAIERMRNALSRFVVDGVDTSLPFLRFVMTEPEFAAAQVNTNLVGRLIERMSGTTR